LRIVHGLAAAFLIFVNLSVGGSLIWSFVAGLYSGLCLLFLVAILVIFFPLGFEMAIASLWLDFSVESAPRGEWSVINFGVDHYVALHHGTIYERSDALTMISNWITRSSGRGCLK
jgi:hypothetical protein